jgi:magnesium transporter
MTMCCGPPSGPSRCGIWSPPILETNLSIQGNRLNTITKKVTSWAAIIAVPTAVTGFYGMNVPYPGFGRPAGAVTSTVLIVLLSGGLYLLFKRLDWL